MQDGGVAKTIVSTIGYLFADCQQITSGLWGVLNIATVISVVG
jgi:hypothetical protein